MGIFDFFSSSSNFEKKVLFGTLHLSLCAVDGETSSEEVTKSLELLKIKPSDFDYFMKRVQKKIDKGGDSLHKELLKLSGEDKRKLVTDLIEISKSDGHFDQAEADVIFNLTGAWGWNRDLIEEALALSGFKKEINKYKIDKEYSESGKLYRETSLIDGKKNGMEKIYHPNGNLQIEHKFIMDKKNGPFKDYYESGSLKMEGTYKDDVTDGESKSYYENGNINEIAYTKNGEPTGIWKRYYENGEFEEEIDISKQTNEGSNLELTVDMDQLGDLPPSPVKSIDDLDLDPEIKKKLEESTLFVNEDGTFDESKGTGKDINDSLDFTKKLKGIDIEKIVFDLKTFQTMDETVPPYTDINGSWHVKFETIMKCFSEENLEKELDELLKLNNISKDSGKVNLNVMSGTEPLTFYEGNGFTIEIPPVDGSRKLIVIKKDE